MIPFLVIRALAMGDWRRPDGRKAKPGSKGARFIHGVLMEDVVAGFRRVGYEAAQGKHHVNGSFFKLCELIVEQLDAKAPQTPNRVTKFILSGEAPNQEVPPPSAGLAKGVDPFDDFEEVRPE